MSWLDRLSAWWRHEHLWIQSGLERVSGVGDDVMVTVATCACGAERVWPLQPAQALEDADRWPRTNPPDRTRAAA